MRVMGIDPGLRTTGYGLVELVGQTIEPTLCEAGVIRVDAKQPLEQRLGQLHKELDVLVEQLRPSRMAVEKLYAHYKHPRTAILMGHARGVVLLAAEQAGVATRHPAATQVKKSLTGNGHASKGQIQRAVQSLFQLEDLPEPPDVADALAIALCAGRRASAE